MDWLPIATAPKNGSILLFTNDTGDKHSLAYWADYSWFPEQYRDSWPDGLKTDLGEWVPSIDTSMNHWAYPPQFTKN